MDRELIFSILAFVITACNTVIYWRGIVRKEIIPHPFTMFIWTIVLGISSVELFGQGEYFGMFSITFSGDRFIPRDARRYIFLEKDILKLARLVLFIFVNPPDHLLETRAKLCICPPRDDRDRCDGVCE